jgi:hypothetical protein
VEGGEEIFAHAFPIHTNSGLISRVFQTFHLNFDLKALKRRQSLLLSIEYTRYYHPNVNQGLQMWGCEYQGRVYVCFVCFIWIVTMKLFFEA